MLHKVYILSCCQTLQIIILLQRNYKYFHLSYIPNRMSLWLFAAVYCHWKLIELGELLKMRITVIKAELGWFCGSRGLGAIAVAGALPHLTSGSCLGSFLTCIFPWLRFLSLSLCESFYWFIFFFFHRTNSCFLWSFFYFRIQFINLWSNFYYLLPTAYFQLTFLVILQLSFCSIKLLI